MSPPRLSPRQVAAILVPGLALLIVFGWVLGTVVVPRLTSVDARVGSVLLSDNGRLTNAMEAVSFLGSGFFLTLVGVAVAIELLRRRHPWSVVLIALSAIGATVLSSAVKAIVERPRPAIERAAVVGASFPSGHATESVAFYGAVAFVAWHLLTGRWLRAVVVTAAAVLVAAIATSRLVLGVHYLSDVLGGLLLGSLWLALCVVAMRPGS